jgi:hypothetical protein
MKTKFLILEIIGLSVFVFLNCKKDVMPSNSNNSQNNSTNTERNFVINGDFEKGLNGWDPHGKCYVLPNYNIDYIGITNQSHSGNYACIMECGNTQGPCGLFSPYLSQKIYPYSGNKLKFSAFVKNICTSDVLVPKVCTDTLMSYYNYNLVSLSIKVNNNYLINYKTYYTSVSGWRKVDTTIYQNFSNDTIEIILRPGMCTFPYFALLIDDVEIKN